MTTPAARTMADAPRAILDRFARTGEQVGGFTGPDPARRSMIRDPALQADRVGRR